MDIFVSSQEIKSKMHEALSQLVFRAVSAQIPNMDLRAEPRVTRHIYNEWMAGIMISSTLALVIMKVHFNHPALHLFVPSKSDQKIDDLVKEICNQIAGPFKTVLLGMKLEAGISLPFITPGFDELFFNDRKGQDGLSSAFDIVVNNEKLFTFSYDFQMLQPGSERFLPAFAEDLLKSLSVEFQVNDVEML